TLCVRHGLGVMQHREAAAALIATQAREAFARIGAPGLVLDVAYAPSAPKDEQSFRDALVQKRPADLRRGSANIGPHRDALALSIDGHAVRGGGWEGEHGAVTLSLKSAEIDVVGNARGVRPILLLDDVSSELDRARTAALFSFLRNQRGQVFLTTTRPELIDVAESGRQGGQTMRLDVVVQNGRISGGSAAGSTGGFPEGSPR